MAKLVYAYVWGAYGATLVSSSLIHCTSKSIIREAKPLFFVASVYMGIGRINYANYVKLTLYLTFDNVIDEVINY